MCDSHYDDYYTHRTDGPASLPWIITTIGLRRLRGRQINDEAVNYYLKLLCKTQTHLRCTTIDSLMLQRMFCLDETQHQVTTMAHEHRKLRRLDLYQCDMIFAPMIVNGHITLITADRRIGEITHEDSFGNCHHGGNSTYAIMLRELLRVQWEWRQQQLLPERRSSYTEEWQCTAVPTSLVPQQVGGTDCGIFTCAFATMKALRLPITHFHQGHVNHMRRHIANCIIKHICPGLQIQGQNAQPDDHDRIATEETLIYKREKTERKRMRDTEGIDLRHSQSDDSDIEEKPSDTRKGRTVVCYRAGDNPLHWRKKAKLAETKAQRQASDNMEGTSDMISALDSSSKVECSDGRVVDDVCHVICNRAIVELSSPPSLNQLVSDETRHSDSRDVSGERNPTAVFVPNDLVTSRSEIATNVHLRPKRARSEDMEPYSTTTKRRRAPEERDNR
jgi:hypothetical protein